MDMPTIRSRFQTLGLVPVLIGVVVVRPFVGVVVGDQPTG
jgi:hypothetical protein